MAERFYHPQLQTGEIRLSPEESQHVRVSRLRVGDDVILFDGQGHEGYGTIVRCDRREVVVRVREIASVSRELTHPLVLCVPLPHGERQRWLVEKATELGVTRLVPIITRFSDAHSRGAKVDRLRRWVIEASKQCGRTLLMTVDTPAEWEQVRASMGGLTRYFCHPSEGFLWEEPPQSPSGMVIAVGPEGGWSEEEVEDARSGGWTVVGLGPTILRVETAALVACGIARTWLLGTGRL